MEPLRKIGSGLLHGARHVPVSRVRQLNNLVQDEMDVFSIF